MPRLYRPSELYEVCQRTNRGELLIDLNNVERMREIIGVFGEAQRRYQVPIFAFHLMSNHYHGLFGAPTPQKLERFLGFVHAGIARLINRDQKEPGVVWGGKPHVLPVALDESLRLQPHLRHCWPSWQVRRPSQEGDPRPLLAELQAGRPQIVLSTAFETGIGRRWLEHLAALQVRGPSPAAPGLAHGWQPTGPLMQADPLAVWQAAA